MLVPCPDDLSFGPGSSCRTLDFTLYFENVVLSIIPDALFLVLTSFRLHYLWHRPVKLRKRFDYVLLAKIIISFLVISAHVVLVALLARHPGEVETPAGIPASVLALISTVLLGLLVMLEHGHTLSPSTLVLTYALIRGVFGSAVLRTFSAIGMFDSSPSFFMVSAICTAAYILLLLVEMVEKRLLFQQEYAVSSIEVSSSVITRSCYFWLFPVLWKGHKSTLTLKDLKDIPYESRASPARDTLEAALRSPNNTKQSLVWASTSAFALSLLAPVIPRMLLLLLTFAQPLLVTDMISFTENLALPSSRGWALVGGFVCVYGLMTLATALYWEQVFLNAVQCRAALVGSIYLKTLRLSSHASNSVGSGVASTYMSVDVERITDCIEFIHELWAAIASIVLAVVILYFQASWAAFVPAGVIVLVLFLISYIGRAVGKRQATWMGATDERIKFLSSLVTQFLSIKWSAYEKVLSNKAEALRLEETQNLTQRLSSRMATLSGIVSNNAGIFCLLSVLGTYAGIVANGGGDSHTLDVKRMFTITTTVNLMSTPLIVLGQNTPSLFAGYASLKRLQSFLRLEEKPDAMDTTKSLETPPDRNVLVQLKDASFSWTPNAEPFLHNITMNLHSRKLHVCVGPVAAGKSMLLNAILGEVFLKSGMYLPPRVGVAYASQDSFIFPGTLRENIVFGKTFNEKRYQMTLAACGLLHDLSRLPDVDQTRLGDKGNSLSGGQRQRLGLARAVYADCPVTLLDDVFSALDAETEAHVFRALFGPDGLLHDKAVLLVTHNLYHLQVADNVIIIENGSLTHSGTLDEIRVQGYNLDQIHNKHRNVSLLATESPQITETFENKAIIETDETQLESKTLQKAGFFASYHFFVKMNGCRRMVIASILVFGAFGAVRFCAQGYLEAWSQSNDKNWGSWLAGYSSLSILSAVSCGVAVWYYVAILTRHGALKIHAAELGALFATKPLYFTSTSPGQIINRFSQDIFTLDFVIPIALLNGFIQSLWLLGTLILIFIPTPWLALSIPPLGYVYFLLVTFYLGTSKQLQSLESASKSPLYDMFGTTLAGLTTIRAFRSQSFFQNRNDQYINDSQGPFHFRFAGMRFLRTGLALITLVVAAGLASLAVALRTTTSSASLGLALSNLTQLTVLLSTFITRWADIENGTVALDRIHEIVSLPPEDENPPDAPMSVQNDDGERWPSQGSIIFDNVTLRYKEHLPPALSNVSFRVEPGQKVGICGRTGSGKSSIAMSLYRAVDRSLLSGKIFVDGVNIQALPLCTLRQSLSLVSQEPLLWYSSVRDNLDPEGACTDSQIWTALDLVGVKDTIAHLPLELETIFEHSESLSRGEKQLICLARVLLRKRKVVVLDEASSSMDQKTDQKIRRVVQEQFQNQTVIAIAHRIATIIEFDIILVIDDGMVVEVGRPADLLANQYSRFFALAANQGLVLKTR